MTRFNHGFLLFVALALPVVKPAAAALPRFDRSCVHRLWENTTASVKPYLREIKSTHGLRLFLKKSELIHLQRLKYGGFLVEVRRNSNRFSSLLLEKPLALFGVEDHRLSPFDGLYHQIVRRPVAYLTDKILGQQLEPAFFLRFPIGLLLTLVTYQEADSLYNRELIEHIRYTIHENSRIYDDLIKSDYRYHRVREDLEDGVIDHDQALKRAYWIFLAYQKYYEYDASLSANPNLDTELHFLDHLLFAHLKPVIEEGVKPVEGFTVPAENIGPLSKDKKLTLFRLNHQLYFEYEVIAQLIRGGVIYNQVKDLPKFAASVRRVRQDPFSADLIRMRDRGEMSSRDLQYLLQQDAFWRTRFEEWKTIGVVRLKLDGDGRVTDQPLTLDDIRKEILNDWRDRAPQAKHS